MTKREYIRITKKGAKELSQYMLAIEDKLTEAAEGNASVDNVIIPITPAAKRALDKISNA